MRRRSRRFHVGVGRVWGVLLLLALPAAAVGQARPGAIPPGAGLGGSFGIATFGSTADAPIANGPSWEVFLGGGLSNGLFARGGLTLSGHDVAPRTPAWQFLSWFVEPRWVALRLSQRVSPFVAGRAGRIREKVLGRSYEFKATGWSYGGGGGVLLRVAPQIALEAGVMLGRTRFADYTFRGEFAWKDCLDHLEAGTPLPASVSSCAGSRSVGGVVKLCYPPYSTEETGYCSPPAIPYSGTARTGNWLRSWIGVHLSLSTGLRD